MIFIEKFSGNILKIYVFLGPFTCLTLNAAHHGTSGEVAVVGLQVFGASQKSSTKRAFAALSLPFLSVVARPSFICPISF